MLEIIDYIEKNARTCTLKETALLFNYHPKYLSQLIKQTFNKTFKEIQTEQRMKMRYNYCVIQNYQSLKSLKMLVFQT